MRNFLLILCLYSLRSFGQVTVVKPICAEYRSGFLCSDGSFRAFNAGSASVVSFPLQGSATSWVDGDGGFNSFHLIDNLGKLWINLNDFTTNFTGVPTDSSGNTINNASGISCMAETYAYINTTDNSVMYGGDDSLHLCHSTGGVKMRPIKISGSIQFSKVAMGFFRVVGLATNGDVYEWVRNSGSIVPVKKTIPRPAIDIFNAHYDYSGCLIPKATGSQTMGEAYVWGSQNGAWQGSTTYTQPTNIMSQWGLTGVLKQVCTNWNATHVIDSAGQAWANAYSRSHGELGDGYDPTYQYTYGQPYSATLNDGENPSGATMVQISPGIKWKRFYSNSFFVFYKFGIDSSGNLYHCGSGKARVAGDGHINNQEATYRGPLDDPIFTLKTPLTAVGRTFNFTLPNIGAGATQNITGSVATVTATGHPALLINVSNSTDTLRFSVASWLWTKVSGGTATISSPSSKSTTITGLTTGAYVFQVLMTDNYGGTDTGKVTINVTATSNCNCTYYFSSSGGSDGNTGTNANFPYQTRGKLNSLLSDTTAIFLFKRGDTWTGSVKNFTGKYADAYGSGARPEFNGWFTPTFTAVGPSTWQASCPDCSPSTVLVTFDGRPTGQAQTPNPGRYWPMIAFSGNNYFKSGTSLAGITVDALTKAAMRTYHYILQTDSIRSVNADTVFFSAANSDPNRTSSYHGAGMGFFLIDHPAGLDTAGEWYTRSGQLYFYAAADPTGRVKVATIDTLFSLANGSSTKYIANISFAGANKIGVYVGKDTGLVFKNNSLSYCSNGVFVGGGAYADTIRDNKGSFVLDQAFFATNKPDTAHGAKRISFVRDSIANVGRWPGMARGVGDAYQNHTAVYNQSQEGSISYNRADSIGGAPYQFYNWASIDHNYFNYHSFVTDDVSGAYAIAYTDSSKRKRIDYNYGSGAVGATNGTDDGKAQAYNFYLDNFNTNIGVRGNISIDAATAGFFLHNTHSLLVDSNIAYQTIAGSVGMEMFGDDATRYNRGDTVKYNTFYNSISGSYPIAFINGAGVHFSSRGEVIDNNYYSHPGLQFFVYDQGSKTMPYSQFGDSTGDRHSNLLPKAASFLTNFTGSPVSIGLNSSLYDVRYQKVFTNTTLPPYSAQLLMQGNYLPRKKGSRIRFN
jgi:hypothetical protein